LELEESNEEKKYGEEEEREKMIPKKGRKNAFLHQSVSSIEQFTQAMK